MSQRRLLMALSLDPATSLNAQENTALITLGSTGGAPNKTWASGSDWDRHQARITNLYQTEPLREVMRIMESDLGFNATQRMYKKRIHDWGLDKNKKENEMRAVVRKQTHRQRQGKPSAFRVRGKAVDYGDIVRYYERKGMSIEDVVAQRAMSATPDAVKCSTPVPSPLSTPKEFAIPENVIRCIRDYFHGSFESGTWISTDPRLACKSIKVHGDTPNYLKSLYHQCMLSCQLFDRSRFQEGGRTLICAAARIKRVIQQEKPGTLRMVFLLVIQIARLNRPEIATALLRQFANMGKEMARVNHPLSRICAWLASLETSSFHDVLIICLQRAGDQFEHFLGPMHYSTLRCRLDCADMLNRTQHTGQRESVIEKLLVSCNKTLGSSDVRTLKAYKMLVYLHLDKGDYIAAQRGARQIIQYAQDVEPREYLTHFRSYGLRLLAQSQYMLGEMASAEAIQRQAIKLRMSKYGTNDVHARVWVVDLEEWAAEQGNLAYAAQLRDWRRQNLSSIEMEED